MHGAFEVGALKALVNNLDPLEVHYDYVSGVSVGALISSWIGIYDFGQEKEAIRDLEAMFISNKPLFKFWPTYFLEPFWKNSIIDPTAMYDIL